MMTVLRKLLGADKAAKSHARATRLTSIGSDNPSTIDDGSESTARRQLVQVLLRDTMRKHGIPPAWLDVQMLVVHSRAKGPGMYVRLVLKHWDERFLKFMPAFQATLHSDILRFEPRAAIWIHGLSWQLEVQSACPYTEMPHKDYWFETMPRRASTAAQGSELMRAEDSGNGQAPQATSSPTPDVHTEGLSEENNPKGDLEQLFAIRDQELNRMAADDHSPVGYEKTQPSPL